MRQFNDTYSRDENVAPLVRQLPWSHHLIILGQSKRPEEREFYLRVAIQERWSKRLSPALIAEYQTQLPDKKLLQSKLHEFYLQNAAVPDEESAVGTKRRKRKA